MSEKSEKTEQKNRKASTRNEAYREEFLWSR